MRTTLTLDDDVSIQLKTLQRKQQKSFRDLVNEVLRIGLRQISAPPSGKKTFRTKTVDLGRCMYGSVDDVAEVFAVAEEKSFR